MPTKSNRFTWLEFFLGQEQFEGGVHPVKMNTEKKVTRTVTQKSVTPKAYTDD